VVQAHVWGQAGPRVFLRLWDNRSAFSWLALWLPRSRQHFSGSKPCQRLLVLVSRTDDASGSALITYGTCAVADKPAPPALPAPLVRIEVWCDMNPRSACAVILHIVKPFQKPTYRRKDQRLARATSSKRRLPGAIKRQTVVVERVSSCKCQPTLAMSDLAGVLYPDQRDAAEARSLGHSFLLIRSSADDTSRTSAQGTLSWMDRDQQKSHAASMQQTVGHERIQRNQRRLLVRCIIKRLTEKKLLCIKRSEFQVAHIIFRTASGCRTLSLVDLDTMNNISSLEPRTP
jgi:hypothetical protein